MSLDAVKYHWTVEQHLLTHKLMLEVVVCGLLKGLDFVLNIVTCWHLWVRVPGLLLLVLLLWHITLF
ncbi:unnamed protein product, partial [Prunus brigantina]